MSAARSNSSFSLVEPNTPPADVPVLGLNSDDVTARLRLLLDRRALNEEAHRTRRVQVDAYIGINPVPPTGPPDPTAWRPPYAWGPTQANSIPAIFTHPRWAQGPIHQQAMMDPPIVPEALAAMRGDDLSGRPVENSYWRTTVNDLHRTGIFRTGSQEEMPYTAFGTAPLDGSAIQPPEYYIHQASSNRPFMQDIFDVHTMQQQNLHQRDERRRRKGKGKGKKPSSGDGAPSVAVHRYNGTDETCTICLEAYERREMVYRLSCNHLFHEECWDNYIHREPDTAECPNCRGPGVVKSLYRHLGTTGGAAASAAAARRGDDAEFADARSDTTAVSRAATVLMATAEELSEWGNSWSLMSVEEFVRQKHENAWWNQSKDYYQPDTTAPDSSRAQVETTWTHLKTASKTKLPNGRLSMLVDLGSRINVIGVNTEREFSLEAERHGHKTIYEKRKHRLNVNGVGSGSAPCDEEARLPIAVKFEEKTATMDEFKANIATGSGCDLPAILGSQSMQDKDAVILLRKGKEMIVFPGPGGYKIEWSPGSQLLPMMPAPSGHLVIPCDKYAEVNRDKVNTEAVTFWTDHAVGTASSSSSGSNRDKQEAE
jgi:hypothetical protein